MVGLNYIIGTNCEQPKHLDKSNDAKRRKKC